MFLKHSVLFYVVFNPTFCLLDETNRGEVDLFGSVMFLITAFFIDLNIVVMNCLTGLNLKFLNC